MKKVIPSAMLETISPLLAETNALYERIPTDELTLHLADADQFDKSDFYFKISLPNEKNKFSVFYKPESENSVMPTKRDDLDTNQTKDFFKYWISLLEKYTIRTVFDNPARYHADNFFSEIRMADEKANQMPFGFKQLVLLEQVLTKTVEEVQNLLENETDENKKQELQEVIEEVNALRNETSTLPKNEVLKRISQFMGKLLKTGIKYITPVYKRLKEGIFDKITDGTIDALLESGKNLFE